MVPQYSRAQAAGEKPIQAPAPAPGAELTNPPPGNGELPMLGHSFPKATSQTPEKFPSKSLVHLVKHVACSHLQGFFFDGAKWIFNLTQENC